ncbi:MAG: nitric oxide synthase [Rhizobiales bacterium PAR1]|nr:MAG: nitric oxide synthase [Rhizobiales bacterium PAR1]
MLRRWHALPGLFLALMLAVTAGTGAILAFEAAIEARSAPVVAEETVSLADLAARITAQVPGVEKITRTPSGKVRVTHLDNGRPQSSFVDPATGQLLGPDVTPAMLRSITNLHRAWLSGDGGRLVAGLSALAMLVLTITGLLLLKRLVGGWGRLIRSFSGTGARRWHLELGRVAVAGLLFSSVTAIEMSLVGFEIIPDGSTTEETFVTASGGARIPLGQLKGLASLSLADLREITLPDPADTTDPITVKTHTATRFIDASTGDILREDRHTFAWHARDLAYRLHTAEGMTVLALVLGLSASGGVVLALTGLFIGLRKRLRTGAVRGSVAPEKADILILVGSEGGTTFRFGETLLRALSSAGRKVHLAAMNDLPAASPARHMILLAATAGQGEAPASATQFLEKLARWQGAKPEAIVLGFGDRTFPDFCGYADRVETALTEQGFRLALPTERVDRQSGEAFMAWGMRLGEHLQLPLHLEHQATRAGVRQFRLLTRTEYGIEVQAPTAILRFRIMPQYCGLPLPLQRVLGLLPRFEPGDLVAITPPGDTRPRFYSIGSSSRSGVLELCVRHQPGGLCSGYLFGLQPGAQISAAIRPNPAFRPDASKAPLILIGAGAGIAPLIGFLRQTGGSRPVHLYWGGRNPESDFLYRDELASHALDGTLTRLRTIFSRIGSGGYVQDLIAADAADLRAMIDAGGQILICGGRDMADGVRQALGAALAPHGLDLPTLRQSGRLLEDVY